MDWSIGADCVTGFFPGQRIGVSMLAVLKYRLIFGPVMIVLALALFWLDGVLDHAQVPASLQPWLFGAPTFPRGGLLLLVAVPLVCLAVRELVVILKSKGVETSYPVLAVSASIGLVLIWGMPASFDAQHALAAYASVVVVMLMVGLIVHSRGGKTQGATLAGAAVLLSMVYLGVLPGFYLAARRWHSSWIVLAVILVTKSCDIGAYFTGRSLGKHKLIPWLSPGKTWEGLIGGVVTSGLLAVGLVAWANHLGVWHENISKPDGVVSVNYTLPLWAAFLGGASLGLLGQIGDLTASLFKRDAGIKDSGQSIPGFGGVLDVMDSPIVVAPLGYWLMAAAADAALWAS